jgi:sulfatase maturation enzyme AslB (radical SAM superfamily)
LKKKICKKPFEWLEISSKPNNEAFLCCAGWLPYSIGPLKNQSALDLWHGEKAIQIRNSVIDGSFKYCKAELCPHLKDINNGANEDSPIIEVEEEIYQQYVKAATNPVLHLAAPQTLNCAYDSSCNLSCPSCRSNIIQSDKAERNEKQQLINRVLDDIGPSLELLYVTGSGDPFGSRHFSELLTSDLHIRFPKLHYRLHTNALLLDQTRWERIAPIHNKIKEIEISIDGASALSYEENRYPGKWHDLLNRMDFISVALRKIPSIQLKFNFVVQSNNWHEMKDFYNLAESWGASLVKFSKLSNWGTFSEAEYKARSVHLPEHPKFINFVKFIDDSFWLNKKIVSDFDVKIMKNQLGDKKELVIPIKLL